jgi:hypothetical protein
MNIIFEPEAVFDLFSFNFQYLRSLILSYNSTFIEAISTGNLNNEPITIVNNTYEANLKVMLSAANVNLKLFPTTVNIQ